MRHQNFFTVFSESVPRLGKNIYQMRNLFWVAFVRIIIIIGKQQTESDFEKKVVR